MADPDRKELEHEFAVLAELERRRAIAPCLFYNRFKRHEKQIAFHDLGKTHRRRLFLGANRSGKTMAGRNESLAHSVGYRFWEVPGLQLTPAGHLPDREKIDPKYWIRCAGIPIGIPNTGIIVTGLPRSQGIGDNIFPGIFADLPQSTRRQTQVVRVGASVPQSLVLPNGSRQIFASAEQDDISFEGFEVDWAWFDEPSRQSIYNGVWRALNISNGPVWFTLTPLTARFAWMYPWILNPPEDVAVLKVRQTDNPFMTDEQRRAFREGGSFNENEARARLEGEPEFMGGRAIPNFDPAAHVIPAFHIPETWPIILVADPHHLRPTYFLWLAYNSGADILYAFREWPTGGEFHKARSGGRTPAEYAALIRNVEGRRPAGTRVVDPRFGPAEHMRHGFRETSWVERMSEFGLDFDSRVPDTGSIEFGLQRLVDRFHYDKAFPIGPSNSPRLFVFEGLENLITSLLQFGYMDVDDASKGLHKKLNEEFKDPVDALRYAVLYPLPMTQQQMDNLQVYEQDDFKSDEYDVA